MSAPEVKLEDVLGPVQSDLERMRAIMLEQLTDHSASVRDMTDHISRFRGKQLRGALVLLAGEATGNTTDEHPQVAAIVEMIHLATLVQHARTERDEHGQHGHRGQASDTSRGGTQLRLFRVRRTQVARHQRRGLIGDAIARGPGKSGCQHGPVRAAHVDDANIV